MNLEDFLKVAENKISVNYFLQSISFDLSKTARSLILTQNGISSKWGAQPPPAAVRRAPASNKFFTHNRNGASRIAREARALPAIAHRQSNQRRRQPEGRRLKAEVKTKTTSTPSGPTGRRTSISCNTEGNQGNKGWNPPARLRFLRLLLRVFHCLVSAVISLLVGTPRRTVRSTIPRASRRHGDRTQVTVWRQHMGHTFL